MKILEEARLKYRFVVHGYVIMPEHFHLLITEPEVGDPSVVMKVIKERFSRQVNLERKQAADEQGVLWQQVRKPVWQKRFYDFNVWSARKQIEKLRYMHRNPVKRGLVARPEEWPWSSFLAYFYGETGAVRVKSQEWALGIMRRPVESFAEVENPLVWGTRRVQLSRCVPWPGERALHLYVTLSETSPLTQRHLEPVQRLDQRGRFLTIATGRADD